MAGRALHDLKASEAKLDPEMLESQASTLVRIVLRVSVKNCKNCYTLCSAGIHENIETAAIFLADHRVSVSAMRRY